MFSKILAIDQQHSVPLPLLIDPKRAWSYTHISGTSATLRHGTSWNKHREENQKVAIPLTHSLSFSLSLSLNP
jgi:hypothetical protein